MPALKVPLLIQLPFTVKLAVPAMESESPDGIVIFRQMAPASITGCLSPAINGGRVTSVVPLGNMLHDQLSVLLQRLFVPNPVQIPGTQVLMYTEPVERGEAEAK